MTHSNKAAVIPAQAGIQPIKSAFGLNTLDSRLRGNDGALLTAFLAATL